MSRPLVTTNDTTDAAHPVVLGPLPMRTYSRRQALAAVERNFAPGPVVPVAFVNAHTMLMAMKSEAYAATLSRFLLLNDGIGLDIANLLLNGHGFPENLNGTDFVPDLLASTSKPLSIYLLGARPDVVARVAAVIERDHPRHRVVGFRDGYFRKDEATAVVAAINAVSPDLLLVAMGNPLQEFFIAEHIGALDCRVAMGVGALFDFMAERVPRAPRFMRKAGMEWVFRFMTEPRRLGHRYTVEIAEFLGRVAALKVGQWLHGRTPPRTAIGFDRQADAAPEPRFGERTGADPHVGR